MMDEKHSPGGDITLYPNLVPENKNPLFHHFGKERIFQSSRVNLCSFVSSTAS
jgi:hypothetical protein